MRFLPLLLIAWPLAEVAAFVMVGREIGVLSTIGLVILTALAGSILLRIQGFGVLQRVRSEMDAGRDPGRELANGAMILFAGVLLLLPGFLTDIVGILLFIPPVREAVWRLVKGRIRIFTNVARRVDTPALDTARRPSISIRKTIPPRRIQNHPGGGSSATNNRLAVSAGPRSGAPAGGKACIGTVSMIANPPI